MSSPNYLRHNLSIATALARAGVKGGTIPDFFPGVQPVMVLADLSQTYSGEPLEARALAGNIGAIAPAGNRGFTRVECRAPGGIVVEDFAAITTGAFSSYSWVDVVAVPPPGETVVQGQVVQAGGALATSLFFNGWTTAVPSGAGPLDFSTFSGTRGPIRVYVPAGSHFIAFSENVSGGALQLATRFIWREIPAPIGLA